MSEAVSGRKAVEMRLDSGEVVYVSPPSVFLVHSMRQQIEARTPQIDKADYETVLEDAIIPGEKVMEPDAEAAYKKAAAERQRAINTQLNDAWIAVALDLPKGREDALTRYAAALKTARALIPTLPVNDWEAVANFFIVASVEDKGRVLSVATMNLPIEEAEVHNGLLLFRVELRGDVRDGGQPNGVSTEALSPDPTGTGIVEVQQPV